MGEILGQCAQIECLAKIPPLHPILNQATIAMIGLQHTDVKPLLQKRSGLLRRN